MKTYKQTRQGSVFEDVAAEKWFSKKDPEYTQMLKERKEGTAVVLPFKKTPADRRKNRYLSIPQAEVNEALIDFLLYEKRDRLDALKAKFDQIKEELPDA